MNRLFLLLSFLMGVIVLASNYLVQFPIPFFNLEKFLTYGAFSYPIAFLITDLANRSYGIQIAKDGVIRSAKLILGQKNVNLQRLRDIWSEIPFYSSEIDEQIEINAHYRGYLVKQKADILAFKRDENLIIPPNIDYDGLSGLSNEVKFKFKQIKPKTMGQALRIDGITPAAVYILLSYVKRKSLRQSA